MIEGEKKIMASSCEEYVLRELDGAQESLAAAKKRIDELEGTIKYADQVIGILRQVFVLREMNNEDEVDGDSGDWVLSGGLRLCPGKNANDNGILKLLKPLFSKQEDGVDIDGAAPEADGGSK